MSLLVIDVGNDLSNYVEKLTTCGKKELDQDLMKKVKRICKTSDEYVQHLYHLVMTQMNKDHAEVRYSSLLVINEIFIRSHVFRELLLSEFQEFLELSAEIDLDFPLPPPKAAAKNLKLKTLQFVQEWHIKFGEGYKRLSLGYQYLKQCKKIDFNDIQAQNAIERQRVDETQRRRETVITEKVNKAKIEMLEISEEISNVLTQMENCFRLLLPHPEEFFTEQDLMQPSTSGTQIGKNKPPGSVSNALSNVDQTCKNSNDRSQTTFTSGITDNSTSVQEKQEFLTAENYGENASNDKESLRHHGFYDRKFNLTIQVTKSESNTVEENEDTSAIIENLRDLHCQIESQYIPEISKWMKIFTAGSNCTDSLKKAIDLKQMIEGTISKFWDLKIKPRSITADDLLKDGDNEDEDDDFEEVKEKEGFEPVIPLHKRKEYGLGPLSSNSSHSSQPTKNLEKRLWNLNEQEERDSIDPTSRISTLKTLYDKFKDEPNLQPSPANDKSSEKDCNDVSSENSRKKKLLAMAPVLPFDVDLYHWEEEKLEAPTIVQYDSLHSFWQPQNSEDLNEAHAEEGKAALRRRFIEFSGKFVPVKWSCRALLPSGKLCPRKDRYKCPFHGPIIARDDEGKPVNSGEVASCSVEQPSTSQSQFRTKEAAVPDWQDPELLRDIEVATGINLKLPEKRKAKGERSLNSSKGKSKKRKKFPGLTDIETAKNTTRKRLEKKVLNKSALQRVSNTLDSLDQKRFSDKFGNQWNYAFNL